MAESTHTVVPTVKDSPGGRVARYRDKSIRGEGAAAIFTRAAQFGEHFLDSSALGATFASLSATTTNTKYTITVNGTGTASIAISKTASGGILTLTTSAAAGGTANGVELAGTQVIWEPEELGTGQKMLFEARVRINALTAEEAYWGWSDVTTAAVVTGTLFAISSASAGTLHTNNAFAFGYSSNPTSGVLDQSGTTTNYFGIMSSVTGTTTVTVASTGVGGDTKFHIYSLLVDAAGNADAFIDDVFVGYTQFVAASGAGVNPTIAFTPYFGIAPQGAGAARSLDIDYFQVATTFETGV